MNKKVLFGVLLVLAFGALAKKEEQTAPAPNTLPSPGGSTAPSGSGGEIITVPSILNLSKETLDSGVMFCPSRGLTTLGMRNNNPGNIVKSAANWKGKVPSPNRFEKFDTMVNGLRAMLYLILNSYLPNPNRNTPRKFAEVWGGEKEGARPYANLIKDVVGLQSIDTVIEPTTTNVGRLATAIVRMETNCRPGWKGLNEAFAALPENIRAKMVAD